MPKGPKSTFGWILSRGPLSMLSKSYRAPWLRRVSNPSNDDRLALLTFADGDGVTFWECDQSQLICAFILGARLPYMTFNIFFDFPTPPTFVRKIYFLFVHIFGAFFYPPFPFCADAIFGSSLYCTLWTRFVAVSLLCICIYSRARL